MHHVNATAGTRVPYVRFHPCFAHSLGTCSCHSGLWQACCTFKIQNLLPLSKFPFSSLTQVTGTGILSLEILSSSYFIIPWFCLPCPMGFCPILTKILSAGILSPVILSYSYQDFGCQDFVPWDFVLFFLGFCLPGFCPPGMCPYPRLGSPLVCHQASVASNKMSASARSPCGHSEHRLYLEAVWVIGLIRHFKASWL